MPLVSVSAEVVFPRPFDDAVSASTSSGRPATQEKKDHGVHPRDYDPESYEGARLRFMLARIRRIRTHDSPNNARPAPQMYSRT